MAKDRRQRKNNIVRLGAQLRYFGYVNLVWTAISIIVLCGSSYLLNDSVRSLAEIENLSEETRQSLALLIRYPIYIAITCLLVGGIFAFLHSLRFSHRVFGPLVPLQNMIKNLTEGDYTTRLSLRKDDELQELANSMNKLAETLESKKSR